jgi:hypothetical protein
VNWNLIGGGGPPLPHLPDKENNKGRIYKQLFSMYLG